MNKYIQQKGQSQVRVCSNNVCVDATGTNADKITGAATVMLLLFGAAALIAALDK